MNYKEDDREADWQAFKAMDNVLLYNFYVK